MYSTNKFSKIILATTVVGSLLSAPILAHADETNTDKTSTEAITKKALLIINGYEEDGTTRIPTGQARVDYLTKQGYDAQKVQDKVNEILAEEESQNQTVENTQTVIYSYQAPVQSTYQAPAQPAQSYQGTSSSAKEWIAQKESGGSYTTQNGRYYGRYQLDSSYLGGDYSAANQERVADQYVANRYGSWEAAQQFWLTHGWY